jgi:hypothetical protein
MHSLCSRRRRAGVAALAALFGLTTSAAVLGAGCTLNSAAMPVGVQPDITSVIIDPVTLEPVTSAQGAPGGGPSSGSGPESDASDTDLEMLP